MRPTLRELGELLRTDPGATDRHFYGQVQSVNKDENGKTVSYSVSLGGSSDTMTCRKLAGAKEGDVVMVTLMANGTAVVTGTLGGDADAGDAIDIATDVQERADSGEFDGEDGAPGPKGDPGDKGEKGDPGESGAPGAAGADAITMAITASNGNIFKDNTGSTVLTAHVYQAGAEVTGSDLAALGTIRWYKDGGSTAAGTGATLTVSASDVAGKAVYEARLEG